MEQMLKPEDKGSIANVIFGIFRRENDNALTARSSARNSNCIRNLAEILSVCTRTIGMRIRCSDVPSLNSASEQIQSKSTSSTIIVSCEVRKVLRFDI
mmetsp:Transcript_1265/g.2329  ORF Transcript_1265/g.2329 Transcript_1265/m.2329 type:complete len:98 (-) Transcript_1265:419-712(-)